jgi:hypothetical protein
MKQRIRLTESDLHRIIKESVKKIIKENSMLGVSEESVSSVIENICQEYGCSFDITRYDDFLCVELDTSYYKVFNACTSALEEAFGKENITGDAFMNSIYVNL